MDFKIESFNLRQMCKCANAREANKPTNPTNLQFWSNWNSESSQTASEKGSNPSRLQNCWDKRSNGLVSDCSPWNSSLGLEKCIFHGLEKCIFHAMDSQTNWKIFHFHLENCIFHAMDSQTNWKIFHFHFHLEKCIFHAMDSQTNWKIWAVVETKLPETLSLFFFPSFHNLYFRTQHHLIKI